MYILKTLVKEGSKSNLSKAEIGFYQQKRNSFKEQSFRQSIFVTKGFELLLNLETVNAAHPSSMKSLFAFIPSSTQNTLNLFKLNST